MRGVDISLVALGAGLVRKVALHADLICLASICLCSAALGLLWFVSVPFAGGADEPAHFQVVRFIQLHGRLPVFRPGELWLYRTEVGVVESYGAFPPLAYVLGALTAAIVPSQGFWGARAVSLLSNLGTVCVCYLAARRLCPQSRSVAVGASMLVATLPKFTFIGAYVNNDALATFGASLLLYVLLRVYERPRLRGFIITGLVIGFLLLTKYTAYACAAAGLTLALVLTRRARHARLSVSLLVGSIAASAGWWFVRNVWLYGEPIPGGVIAAAKESAGGNTLFVASKHGINLFTLSFATDFWSPTLESFVASFNCQKVFLPFAWYALYAAIALVGLAGFGLRVREHSRGSRGRLIGLLGGLIIAGTLLSTMAINVYGEWSPQGRYLFPSLVPMAIGVAMGWQWLGRRIRISRALPIAALGLLVAANAIILWGYAVPAYYGASLAHIVLQVDEPAAASMVQGSAVVAGWALVGGASDWQPFSPESVSQYRQPVDEVAIYRDGPAGAGRLLARAQYGLSRPDVSDYYGKNTALSRVGYRAVIPRADLSPGTTSLFVCATARALAHPSCVERTIRLAPDL